jgi:small subunit ribosomal protein S21
MYARWAHGGRVDVAAGSKGLVKPGRHAMEVPADRLHIRDDPLYAVGMLRGATTRSLWSVEVQVRDNNVDQALRALKKKMQREGLYREMRMRRHYEKPSEKKARERAEAIRRFRKLQRKRRERDEI